MCLQDKSFENTAGKGEIARYKQFVLFPQYFLPSRELSAIFKSFKFLSANSFGLEESKFYRLGKGLTFWIWMVNHLTNIKVCNNYTAEIQSGEDSNLGWKDHCSLIHKRPNTLTLSQMTNFKILWKRRSLLTKIFYLIKMVVKKKKKNVVFAVNIGML